MSAFFNSDDEAYRVLIPFIKDGFACGDRAIHAVNPEQRNEHLLRLAAAAIDPTAAQQSGQFELQTNLRDGRFYQDRMLAAFKQLASGNVTGAYPLSRIVCRMDWAAANRSHVDDLVEFEARVNDVWCQHDDAAISTYTPIKVWPGHGGRHHEDASYDHHRRYLAGARCQGVFVQAIQGYCPARSAQWRLGSELTDPFRCCAAGGMKYDGDINQRIRRCIEVFSDASSRTHRVRG